MPYLEYVKPNTNLKSDVEAILGIGIGKGAEEGLAERAKALKDILKKWDGKLSQGFKQAINEIVKSAAILVDKQGRPKPPHWKGYTREEYAKVVEDSWNKLIDFYEKKEDQTKLPSKDPGTLFVLMTEDIKKLAERLTGKDVYVIKRGTINYVLTKSERWPDRQITEVTNQSHVREFRDLARNCEEAKEDQVRFRFYEKAPEVKKNDTKRTTK